MHPQGSCIVLAAAVCLICCVFCSASAGLEQLRSTIVGLRSAVKVIVLSSCFFFLGGGEEGSFLYFHRNISQHNSSVWDVAVFVCACVCICVLISSSPIRSSRNGWVPRAHVQPLKLHTRQFGWPFRGFGQHS